MKTIALAAAALAACATQQPSTALQQLNQQYGGTSLEVIANGQLSILLHVNTSSDADCPRLGDNLTATFDGASMKINRGGYDTNSSGCYPIAFWFDVLPQATVANFELAQLDSELVVADPTATWTIDTVPLFQNDFVNDQANSRIVWEDVSSIADAELSGATVASIQGNEIDYKTTTGLDWVQAHAHPIPTRCDGPGGCAVDLYGYRDYSGLPK